MSWQIDGVPLHRVLVTRLRYLGDIVMSTVVLQALRRGDPDLEIDYLCESGFAEVLAGQAELGMVHRLGASRRGADARARGHQEEPGPRSHGTLATIRRLRSRRYDLAVDLFFNPRSAWLLRLGGIPFRIGGTERSRRQLYTHTVLRSDPRCASAGFTALAPGGLGEHLCRLAPLVHGPSGRDFVRWFRKEFSGGPALPGLAPRTLDDPARLALERAGIDPAHPYLLAAPGATWPTKEWPAEKWTGFASGCRERFDAPLVMLVPPGRSGEFSDLGRENGLRLLEPLPLASALAVVARARAVVSVDGGVMHAAVGYGRPTVALFGPTDPGIWFPYESAPRFRVLATRPECHPCDLHQCGDFVCLPDLDGERVLGALSDVLATEGSHA